MKSERWSDEWKVEKKKRKERKERKRAQEQEQKQPGLDLSEMVEISSFVSALLYLS